MSSRPLRRMWQYSTWYMGVRSVRVHSATPGPGSRVMKLSTGDAPCPLECTAFMSWVGYHEGTAMSG